MEHHTENLSKEERDFNEVIKSGDDLMKIQLFRNAKECYETALGLNFNNALVQDRLVDCKKEIKSESRIIIRTLIVMGVVAAAIIIYMNC